MSVEVEKYSCGVSLCCDCCDRVLRFDNSTGDSLYVITLINGTLVTLCSECASQLADNLCGVLGKTRVDTDSKSCEEG